MSTFTWRKGGPKPPIDAQVFGDEVEKIARRRGLPHDQIKPEDIVEAARSKRSPIHDAFPFNDVQASAEEHWKQLARHYIGSLQIVVAQVTEQRATSSKAYFSVTTEGNQRAYVPKRHIETDRDLRAMVITDARRQLESYINKYQDVLDMAAFVPRLREVLDAMRDELDMIATAASRRSDVIPKIKDKDGDADQPGAPV